LSQKTKENGLLVAQQSAKRFLSHVEYDEVKVHVVVEPLPCAAMPKLQRWGRPLIHATLLYQKTTL
jgi:hypothetical protein